MEEEDVQSLRQKRRKGPLKMAPAGATAHPKKEEEKNRRKKKAEATEAAVTAAGNNFTSSANVGEQKKEKSFEQDVRKCRATGEVGAAFTSALQDILGTSPSRRDTAAAAATAASRSSSSAVASSSPRTAAGRREAAAGAAAGDRAAPAARTAPATGREKKEKDAHAAAVLKERPGIFAALAKTQRAAAVEKRALLERKKRREAAHVKPLAADGEYERELRTIATKGVVRFLNAVMKFRRQQAKGKTDFRKEKQRKFQIRKKSRSRHRTP